VWFDLLRQSGLGALRRVLVWIVMFGQSGYAQVRLVPIRYVMMRCVLAGMVLINLICANK